MDQRQNEKKKMISYKNQDIISYMQMKKKKKNLTLTCQTRAIIEKNIGIN